MKICEKHIVIKHKMEYYKQSSQAHSTTRRMQTSANRNLDILVLLTNWIYSNILMTDDPISWIFISHTFVMYFFLLSWWFRLFCKQGAHASGKWWWKAPKKRQCQNWYINGNRRKPRRRRTYEVLRKNMNPISW